MVERSIVSVCGISAASLHRRAGEIACLLGGKRIYPCAVLSALSVVLLAGCSRGGSPPAQERRAPAPIVPVVSDAPPGVTLEEADETELAEAIRSHRGKAVLVDYWATWCISCVELFPHTVELHERFADQGLVVISVSFDDPESEPEVRRFLAEKGAAFENFISPYGVGPRAVEAFDIDDGALPHFRIYDRAGNEHRRFGGSVTADEIDQVVGELLEQPSVGG